MMMEKDPKSKRVRRTVKKLLIAVACGFLLAAVGLAVMIAADQFRSVPEISDEVWFRIRDEGTAPKEDGPQSRRIDDATKEQSRSDKARSDEDVAGMLEDMQAKCRPFPDLSEVPEDLRGEAERLNGIMAENVSELMSIWHSLETRSYKEVYRDTGRLIFGATTILSEQDRFGENTSSITEAYEAYLQLSERLRLAAAIHFEKWEDAACSCSNLQGGDWNLEKESIWWQQEIYCWRKAGLRGRAFLALRSSSPVLLPIAYAIENTFEPPLDWICRRL